MPLLSKQPNPEYGRGEDGEQRLKQILDCDLSETAIDLPVGEVEDDAPGAIVAVLIFSSVRMDGSAHTPMNRLGPSLSQ